MSNLRTLTIVEAAERTGISAHTFYRAVARRDLPVVRVVPRGRIRIRETVLEAWLERHTTSSSPSERGAHIRRD
ncbi:MAG: helix-turn-helix domain-containing protein [Vicinamibacterales bacterium]